jgi:hypothetical protein
MPLPIISIYHDDSTQIGGTPVDGTNPAEMGLIDKGTISPTVVIHIWNGKNDPSVGTAVAPKLYSLNGSGDASKLFNGTAANGFKSMLEARSCTAIGTSADQQKAWTPIGPNNLLTMGNMPPNSMRGIELRLNIPIDAPDMNPEDTWSLRVSA